MYKLPFVSQYSIVAIRILFSIALCSFSNNIYAQYLRHFNAHQLLGTQNVYHIAKDRAGFLWFCTNNGLIKYDGHATQSFTKQDGLADNMVFNIYEDHIGQIWAFCANGRYCFIDSIAKVHNEANDSLLRKLPHSVSYITTILQAKDSSYYFIFLADKSILHFKDNIINWIKCSEFNHVVNNKIANKSLKGSFIVSKSKVAFYPSTDLVIYSQDLKHRIISDTEGIKIYENETLLWQIKDPTLTHSTVTDMCLSANKHLLVCSSHGLDIINLNDNKRHSILKGIRLSSCTEDIDGNFWISTANNGIYVLHKELFNIHPLANFNGCEIAQINEGRTVLLKNNKLYELKAIKDTLLTEYVSNNIGNYCNPLLLTDTLVGYFNTWQGKTQINFRNGKSLVDALGFIKKAYNYSAQQYFLYGAKFTQYINLDSHFILHKSDTILPEKITASCQDIASKAVYFIADTILYTCNFKTAQNEIVFTSPRLKLVKNIAFYNGQLFFALDEATYYTRSLVDKNAKMLQHHHGFVVRDFTSMSNHQLLLQSDQAYYLLKSTSSIPEKIQYPFSSKDIEQIIFVKDQAVVQINDERYYFDGSLLNKSQPISQIYLQKIVINRQEYFGNVIDIRKTYKLDIQLSIGILSFSNQISTIRYRVLGMEDSSWSTTNATVFNILLQKPGYYQIEIVNDNVGMDAKPIVIQLMVHTPFFRSNAFIFLCIAVFLLLGIIVAYFIIKYRKNHFKKELDYLKQEHRAINALLNPHFVFNAINNIQHLIHQTKQHESAEYLAVLSRLIRQNLENLQYNLIPLTNELALIERYIKLQNLRFSNNIVLEIEDAEVNDLKAIQIPPLLLHTFVENAIVHGFRDQTIPFTIRIRFDWLKDDYIAISISDNGIGCSNASNNILETKQPKTSMGISFNQKRLQRLSQFYKLDQSISIVDLAVDGKQGTKIVIVLFAKLKELFDQQHIPTH